MLCELEHATAWVSPPVLAARLEAIGFRVLRRRTIDEPLLFFDTQRGTVYARNGRLVREWGAGRTAWRLGCKGDRWMNAASLDDLRGAVPWLPGDVELHPILHAVRSGVVLRLRGLGTRDLTVVVERWGFAGTAPPADAPTRGLLVRAARVLPSAAATGSGAPAAQMPTAWYVAPDEGPRHDRAYLEMLLSEHARAVGLQRGRPAGSWDPLTAGLELIGRLPPGLAAPRRLVVRRADTLTAVLRKTVRLQGLRLASCVDGILCDHHPEYVHDARVAARRARFALLVADASGDPAARELSGRLRRVARLLGPVRDLDVLLARLAELAATAMLDGELDRTAGSAAEQRLTHELRARREERRVTAAEMLQDTDTGCLLEQLSGWRADGFADQPAEGRARDALGVALERVEKAGSAVTTSESVPVCDLHRLRLRLKRLRYTAELFSGALARRRDNRALGAVVAECAAAQTLLGDLNDDAVAETEVAAATGVLRDRNSGDDGVAADLGHRIVAVVQQRQDRATCNFARGWRRQRTRLRTSLQELSG